MGRRPTLAGALAAPLLLLALTACGSDTSVADPPISPPPTSSPAPTPPKRESPEHFVDVWFNIGTRMQNTGNAKRYLALQKGCHGCQPVADRITTAYSEGGYYETRGVRSLQLLNDASHGRLHVLDVQVDLFPTSYKESSAGPVKHFHGGPAHFQLTLMSTPESWLVTRFVQVAS